MKIGIYAINVNKCYKNIRNICILRFGVVNVNVRSYPNFNFLWIFFKSCENLGVFFVMDSMIFLN